MLPAEGVLRAAERWIKLLRRSSVDQGLAIIKADPLYNDLSLTQYAAALDWLMEVRFVQSLDGSLALADDIRDLPAELASQALFSRSLEVLNPSWLPDADVLVGEVSELPQDAEVLARLFGVTDAAALTTIRQLWGRIDAEELARIGAAGEAALVRLLEERWPGSTRHVALQSDAFGYDVLLTVAGIGWHLEVKTTPRRGRLAVHLSRHEYEVAGGDRSWRLVVVGLQNEVEIGALATAPTELLLNHSPQDRDRQAQWRTARFHLGPRDLLVGLPFLGLTRSLGPLDRLLLTGMVGAPSTFSWMPAAATGE